MPRKRKKKFPFYKDNGNVVWERKNGNVIIPWEEFKRLVVLPREEFEKYYKRLKMPKDARDYHRNAKRKNKRAKG